MTSSIRLESGQGKKRLCNGPKKLRGVKKREVEKDNGGILVVKGLFIGVVISFEASKNEDLDLSSEKKLESVVSVSSPVAGWYVAK